MILHARWQGRHRQNRPVLVWLHGFLGSGAEWQAVQNHFTDWPQLSVDLPGHGGSYAQRVDGFETLSQRLAATLRFHHVERYWLIGYSLGGRVALYHACRHGDNHLAGVAVEGAHTGLGSDEERRLRLAHDTQWSARFRQQPLGATLRAWYCQPVFADLSEAQRQILIRLRLHNHPDGLAAMLLATSLAHQPDLQPALARLSCPFLYLCGEHDHKFQRLARQAALPVALVSHAGHNAHRANPLAFARHLAGALSPVEENR
ncbi:2-succinyl-6-hydroxy-2,4-cyclohexadiene-1-carboxylate synthase [Erwinia sp. 9145]|uniref:2-succinyl-6-hydroxy-2, 4-cyclohexadiene-1-carboxylate synthase n=1 Tax=Erwinia sp. 9145 TaxID=1500895 RepID=UPI00055350E6|nr:2-succinyl-6-hydroxy-2,4-cyclohexadiene-1-carboxylate synthase [Erwinia sp. 9145]